MSDPIDDYITEARTLLGTGHSPTPATPTPGTPPATPSGWSGDASRAATTTTATLTTTRGTLYGAAGQTSRIITATADIPRTAHNSLDAIQKGWNTDKAAIAPWGRSPAARAALLLAGQQRIAETHALVTDIANRYGDAAAAVRSARLGLPDTPADTPNTPDDDPANPRRRDPKAAADAPNDDPHSAGGSADRPNSSPTQQQRSFTPPTAAGQAAMPLTAMAAPAASPLASALPSAATSLPSLAGGAPSAISPLLQPLSQISSAIQPTLAAHTSPMDDNNPTGSDNHDRDPNARTRDKIVEQARRALGLPYVWGGGGAHGPSGGGFDCSGLTQFAVAQATNGQIILPRTTYDQIRCGHPVDLAHARPGDLVFSNFSRRGPEHVQIFAGRTGEGVPMVIEAQQTGVPVKFSPLSGPTRIRRLF